MTAARRAIVILGCALARRCASADALRLDDETDVFEFGDCEAELALERQSVRGAAHERGSSVQLGCGIGWRTELFAAFGRRRSVDVRDQGFGVEGRTMLRQREPGKTGWVLVYGADAERGAGRSWRRSEQYIAVEATLQPATAWFLDATVGTAHDRAEHQDRTLWALGVEHAITPSVDARIELGGDDRHRSVLVLDLRYLVWPERLALTVSLGAAPRSAGERSLGIAVTFEF